MSVAEQCGFGFVPFLFSGLQAIPLSVVEARAGMVPRIVRGEQAPKRSVADSLGLQAKRRGCCLDPTTPRRSVVALTSQFLESPDF